MAEDPDLLIEDQDGFDVFQKHRMDIVKSIDTDKQFMFSYLRSNSVLDEEDCERINHKVTRQEKVTKMLDILSLKGPGAKEHFVKAVEFEHPRLYEKITGKKAHSNLTPGPFEGNDCVWDWTKGLDGKALIDFDREFLAKQLDRAQTDLKCMTYWQTKIVKEKNKLEQKLFEATDDLQMKDKSMNDLQEKIIQFTAQMRAEATEEDALQTDQPMQLYLEELWRDNMERANVIIALQGRLLVANEQVDKLKLINSDLEKKNDEFKSQVRNLTIVYDHERRNSRKLSETMMCQTNETDVLKKEILKWKYNYNCLIEERDNLQTELENFQKWAEVLNARFDIVTQEKEELEENSEDICSKYRNLQIHCENVDTKLKWLGFREERFTTETNQLKATIENLRQNRNNMNAAREAAILDRNEAIKGKAKAENELQEMREAHDKDINNHVKLFEELEDNHCKVLKDLAALREMVEEKENEILKLTVTNEQQRLSCSADPTTTETPEQEAPDEEKAQSIQDSCSNPSCTTASEPRSKCKRTHKELIDSIRRKVTQKGKKNLKGGTLPLTSKAAAARNYLDYEQLSLLYPQQFSKAFAMSDNGLHLNLTDPMSRKLATLPPRMSPQAMPSFMFDKMMKAADARNAECKPGHGARALPSARNSLQRMKNVKSEDSSGHQFRSRVNCMDPKGDILESRTRSISSPPGFTNQISLSNDVESSERYKRPAKEK